MKNLELTIPFSIILIIGAFTTFTDLKNKKIYNQHLAIGAVLGLIVTIYAAIFWHENILLHAVNGVIAFLIGFLMHRTALWRGGDAKLLTLYAFIMPTPTYSHVPLLNVVVLFACSFITGTIILFPVFIKDIIINHKTIINDLITPANRQAMFHAVGTVIFFSWILFPIYYLINITNPILILAISYLMFIWGYGAPQQDIRKQSISEFLMQKWIYLCLFILFGFLVRLFLNPNSLSGPVLMYSILRIGIFVIISVCIHTSINHLKGYHDRIPFAPLLFIGCFLSYTPFLANLIRLVVKWTTLF